MLRIFRSLFKQKTGIPNYEQGPTYDGEGAEKFIYLPEFQNPVYLFRGPARVAFSSLRPLQRPQAYFTFRNTVAGMGGLTAGQIITQPLTNSSGTNAPVVEE